MVSTKTLLLKHRYRRQGLRGSGLVLQDFWRFGSVNAEIASVESPVSSYRVQDYLSDTPLLRAMGFLVSQHGQLAAISPSAFSELFPLGEHAKWRCDTPPPQRRGISAILARYPMKQGKKACDTPLCDRISKGYCAIWGGISHSLNGDIVL